MRLIAACLTMLLATLPANAQPRVAVTGGMVEGQSTDGQLLFQGIPFARAPIDDLRWKAPAPVRPWEGVRRVVDQAPACLQNDYRWNRADHLRGSEDCLTVDIGTQSLDGRRPVLIWIHGGSNRAGSGGMATSTLVKRGVVVVSIQYRLGIFGFLPHRALAAEQGGTSGNYGLMDQIAGLRWVRNNIARFGGDPANVTIAGESAGSQDVSLLLASPQARGLFHKAAMESGTAGFGMPFRPLAEALAIGDQLDGLLKARSLAELRDAPAAALLAADLKLHDPRLPTDDYLWLRTTIDGAVLPKSPTMLLAEAPVRPILIGSNAFELDLPGGPSQRDRFLTLSFGTNAERAGAFYRAASADPRMGTVDQQLATDATFRCPAGQQARILAKVGAPVWRYEFDGGGDAMTTHAAEIGNIFYEQRVGGLHLQDYWLNFVHTGDPNGTQLPRWPRYTVARPRHVRFDADGATMRNDLRPEICALQEQI